MAQRSDNIDLDALVDEEIEYEIPVFEEQEQKAEPIPAPLEQQAVPATVREERALHEQKDEPVPTPLEQHAVPANALRDQAPVFAAKPDAPRPRIDGAPTAVSAGPLRIDGFPTTHAGNCTVSAAAAEKKGKRIISTSTNDKEILVTLENREMLQYPVAEMNKFHERVIDGYFV